MHISIKTNNPEAKNLYMKFLKYPGGTSDDNTGEDSGFDLYCPEEITVKAGETVWVNLGIACQASISKGVGCAFYIYPRSSLSKTSLRLANSVGIIDKGYRGNLILALDNIKTEPYTIQKGQRLAQICAPDLSPISFGFLLDNENFVETERGTGGFGSTGL